MKGPPDNKRLHKITPFILIVFIINSSIKTTYWTNVLTSQDSLQNLQDWLGCGSMDGKPAAAVRLPEGEGVPQHPPEHQDLTWSTRQQGNSPGLQEWKEERLLKTMRNAQDSLELRYFSPFLQIKLLSSPTFFLSYCISSVYISASPCQSASLLIPGSPHVQLPAGLVTLAAGHRIEQKRQSCVMLKGMSNPPCSMAARTLKFSSVAVSKLTARSRGSTGQSAGFHQIINKKDLVGGWSLGVASVYLAADFRKASWQESWIPSWMM